MCAPSCPRSLGHPSLGTQIKSPVPQLFFDLYVVQLATFLSAMLMFWLEMFGDMGNGDMQGTDPAQLWEYAPKLVLVFCVWFSMILVYT
jgi:Wnt-binding factor required for Wnt secretion